MLLISRQPSQSLVLNHDLLITLLELLPASSAAHIRLTPKHAPPADHLLHPRQSLYLAPDTLLTLHKILPDKASFLIGLPPNATLDRKELYDKIHPSSPCPPESPPPPPHPSSPPYRSSPLNLPQTDPPSSPPPPPLRNPPTPPHPNPPPLCNPPRTGFAFRGKPRPPLHPLASTPNEQ
ncbi:MAG TPA: hypothetical protein VH253_19295 [Phycisphaerae bacterium]|nr:hypothetical protein [Phycisphaerae bacterium]